MTFHCASFARLLVAGSVPLLAVAIAPRDAAACSRPACIPGHAAPAAGATIPGNTPALPVLLSQQLGAGAPTPEAPATLLDGQGRVVPTTWVAPGPDAREALLKPTAALEPGTYRLVRKAICKLGGTREIPGPADGGEASQTFTVTAPAALPTAAGTVTASAPTQRRYSVVAGGSCSEEVPAAVVDLKLEPSAALVPFLPVARLTVSVNGELWAATLPGGDASEIPRSIYFAGRSAMQLFRVCETKPNVHDQGVRQAQVAGEVVVDIPGHGALPPIPFSATLPCGPAADGGAGAGGASGKDGGGGAGGAAARDGGVDASGGGGAPDVGGGGGGNGEMPADAGAPTGEVEMGGGGCSVGSTGAGPGPAALVAGLLAAVTGLVRRRRRGR